MGTKGGGTLSPPENMCNRPSLPPVPLPNVFVAKGMTTGQGSRVKRERRKKDRARKRMESRPVPGEKEIVKPQVLPAFDSNGISNT